MTDPAEYGGEFYLNRPPWDQLPITDLDRQLGRAVFYRMLQHLDEDELEFIRDEFVLAAERSPGVLPDYDLEAYDWADLAHDEWEIRKYGKVVSSGSVSDE